MTSPPWLQYINHTGTLELSPLNFKAKTSFPCQSSNSIILTHIIPLTLPPFHIRVKHDYFSLNTICNHHMISKITPLQYQSKTCPLPLDSILSTSSTLSTNTGSFSRFLLPIRKCRRNSLKPSWSCLSLSNVAILVNTASTVDSDCSKRRSLMICLSSLTMAFSRVPNCTTWK